MSANNFFDNLNFDPKNMKSLQDKSAEIQNQMMNAQKKLTAINVEGSAGVENYQIKVVLNGRHEAVKVSIDQQLLLQPTQVLCDLVAAAITDAAHKVEVEIMGLFKNFKLPG